MNNDALICLGANNNQLPLIKEARSKGFQIIAIDRNSMAVGFSLVNEKIIESTYDTDKVLEHLANLQSKYEFKGLLARSSGPALKTAAAIVEKYNLPGPTSKIIPLGTEKSVLRDFCKANDLNMPKGQKIKKTEDLSADLTFPLIIKPDLPIVGKKDIKVIYRKSDIQAAVQKAEQASGNGFVEVEEYIEGIDVSCMFTLINGQVEMLALWDELVGINNDGAIKALGVSVPSVIETLPIKQKIEIIVKNFGKLFPELNAVLIMSFRVTGKGGIYIIELHADLGGDLIADILLPKANPKFNFFNIIVDFACGNYHPNTCFFRPTTLIYKPSVILPKKDCHMIDGNAIIQSVSLKKNLDLSKQAFCELKKLPLHEQFIN